MRKFADVGTKIDNRRPRDSDLGYAKDVTKVRPDETGMGAAAASSAQD